MNNQLPYEIVATGEVDLYIAPVATAMPKPYDEPQAPWVKIGTAGGENYDPAGITIALSQTINELRALKDVETRKVVRTSAAKKLSGNIFDLSADVLKLALNGNTIETTAAGADPGVKTIGLSLGAMVTEYALLLRTVSPKQDDGASQWCFPIVAQTGSQSIVYSANGAAGVAVEFTALVDTSQTAQKKTGWYEYTDTDATS